MPLGHMSLYIPPSPSSKYKKNKQTNKENLKHLKFYSSSRTIFIAKYFFFLSIYNVYKNWMVQWTDVQLKILICCQFVPSKYFVFESEIYINIYLITK